MSEPVLEPPHGPQHMAAYQLAQHRKHFPYGSSGFDRMSATEAQKRAAQLGLSSEAALRFVLDELESRHYQQVRTRLMEIGAFAGLDLSDIGYVEILLGTPTALTFRDDNDGSLAIGIDPGFWHMILLSYLLARMANQVDDHFWFLALEFKVSQFFYVGQDTGGAQIIEYANDIVAKSDPGVREMAEAYVGAALSMILAHEVGHIALGHFGAGEGEKFRLDPESDHQNEASIFRDQAKELKADEWAAECLLALAGDNFKEQTLAVTVPALMFWLLAIPPLFIRPPTEIARAVARHHPSNARRALALQSLAGSHANNVRPSNAMKHFVDLAHWVQDIVERWNADPAEQNRQLIEWHERSNDTF